MVAKKIRFELLLLVCSILVVLTLVTVLQLFNQSIMCNDCIDYLDSIQLFLTKLEVHHYRPIGISFFYVFPFLFKENTFWFEPILFVTNLLIYLLIVQFFFQLLVVFFSRQTSFFIAICFIGLLGISINCSLLLSELPFIFVMLVAFCCFSIYFKTQKIKYLHFAISLMLFSVLVRPGALFFVVLLFLFFFKNLLKSLFTKSMIIVVFSMVLLFFQLISMKNKFGDYTFSYIGEVTYYNYLGSKAVCLKKNKVINQSTNTRANYIFSLNFSNQKKVASDDFLYQIKTNSKNLFLAYIDDLEENTKTGSSRLLELKNINKYKWYQCVVNCIQELTEWQNKLLTLFGLIFSLIWLFFYKKAPKVILLSSIYFLYVFFISGISSTQGDRFHVVFFPFALLLIFYSLKHRNILFTAAKQSYK